MDRPFIQKMCESYYSDFTLGKTNIWSTQEEAVSELSGEIFKIMENLKLEDMDLYESLFEFNRQKQYQIIYSLLGEHMIESFSDEILPEEIFEIGTLAAAGIIGAGLTGWGVGFKPITKATNAAIAKFGDVVDDIAKSISKWTTKFKVYNAILFSDKQDCYKRCGLRDEKDLSRLTVLRGTSNITIGKTSENQFKCLTECFFQAGIEQAKILAIGYSQCVSLAGDSTPLNLATIISQNPVRTCKPIYNSLMDLRKEFESAVNHIYINSEDRLRKLKQFEDALESGLKGNNKFNNRPNMNPKKRY